MRVHFLIPCFIVSILIGCSSVNEPGAGKSTAGETPLISQLVRVTMDDQSDEINPIWSPDAATFLYVETNSFADKYNIWQMDLHSGRQTNLTGLLAFSALNPSWSPDGRQIAFFSRQGAAYAVWTMTLPTPEASSNSPLLTKLTDAEHMDIFPAWSPDGTKIAFISDRSGEAAVWVMDRDGKAPVRLTEGGFGDLTPAWSPDGAFLAFTRRVKLELDEAEKDDYYRSLDDLSQTVLQGQTREALYRRLDQVFDLPGRIRVSHLYVLNVASGRLQQLSFDETEDGRPVWSPDGSQLVFSSRRNGNMDLWLINADGTNRRRLTNHPANDRYPAWSPDGKQIAFASDRAGSSDIWILTLNGSVQ
jgi:TolB protein